VRSTPCTRWTSVPVGWVASPVTAPPAGAAATCSAARRHRGPAPIHRP
jgi:hypothetical protein